MTEIIFKADKVHRDRYFTATHFSHPAKMGIPLQRWIIENYTKPGDVILDPMAGSGTVLIACTMGRHVICVELEEKFVKMQRDNKAKIQVLGPELGYEMGTATILQGDARDLEGFLCDSIISSPPYASGGHHADQTGSWGGQAQALRKEQANYGQSQGQIGQLRSYGSIDAVISSPPYEGSDISQTHMTSNDRGNPSNPNYRPSWKRKLAEGYAETKRPYSQVDSIITSPPYEGSLTSSSQHGDTGIAADNPKLANTGRYSSEDPTNIGNLKSDSYLQAMLQVYQQCHKVLKDGGLMVLVVKPFIRNQKEVKLQEDTKIICAKTGFIFLEEHYRVLTSQSFWRTIYARKYPSAPKLDREYILVFQKG